MNRTRTLGVLGGGQLGKMIIEAAQPYGIYTIVLDPDPQCPASQVADEVIAAPYDDLMAMQQLVEMCDLATYEFENVNAQRIKMYQGLFPQKAEALEISQHRFKEKEFASKLNINTPAYRLITSVEQLAKIDKFPVILKTCRLGYDGKGQWILNNQDDIKHLVLDQDMEYIVEEWIDFDFEASTILTRFASHTHVFEPMINTHIDGILATSHNLPMCSEQLISQMNSYSKLMASSLDYVGTMAIEWFVKGDQLYFNEMAPRPHNSGHMTLQTHRYSQFDLHVAAILGISKLDNQRNYDGVMHNLLGQDLDVLENGLSDMREEVLSEVVLYGKKESRINRKMGHITLFAKDKQVLSTKLNHWRKKK